MFMGGEPRNESTVIAAEMKFGQRLCEGYALTECFPLLVVNPRTDLNAPVGSVGRLVASDAQIKLVGTDGLEVARGEVGHALIKSPGRMTEYLGEPEMTAARLTLDGWVKTGDLLREVDGYYVFAGRSTDMIIRGGANISPLEIEAALVEHPKVKDATAVGIPDPVKGEQIVALTVLHSSDTATEAELLAFLESTLAKYKVPQHIAFVDEIPIGATGKKNRRALRDIALNMIAIDEEQS
jgi:long-chain acyl-CoA synthetase